MLSLNFSPFPQIETDRLILRQMMLDDAPGLLALRSNEEVMRYIARPLIKNLDEAVKWIEVVTEALEKNEGITWGICLKDQPALPLGFIGFWRILKEHYRAEIGYILHPSLHGKGIMLEAMQAVLKYGFNELNLHSVEAHVNPHNLASIRLLEKAGFNHEGLFRENIFFEGKFLDTTIYSLLATTINPEDRR